MTLTSGAAALRRGDLHDIESAHRTHRLRLARSILHAAGIEGQLVHGVGYEHVEFGRPKHGCDWTCKTVWPEWATQGVFQQAFDLADAIQSQRGDANQAEAARLHLLGAN